MTRPTAGAAILVATAAVCALLPIPRDAVERFYSRGIYPPMQQALTAITNRVPVAMLDLAAALLMIALLWTIGSRVRRQGARGAFGSTLITLLALSAAVYLWFLALWGLNYRRVPIEEKLDYDRSRISRDSVVAFADRAVREVNGGYRDAHSIPGNLEGLKEAFAAAESMLGSRRVTTIGVPKRSLLTFYFRRAAIDGMTDPLFLEIIVNPDLLDVERPSVLAHEWAHLAGYANESEANFLAWLTCVRGDPLARYSGWLMAYAHAMRALPRSDRSSVAPLDAGPRADLGAMTARYERSSPVVRNAAQGVYDEYLRANRVREGIGSYDAVLRLMVGTRFEPDWKPGMR